MSGYTVQKCICHDRTFEEIKDYSESNGYEELEELQADHYCSCSCGFCVPYIELMFKTGETEFRPGAHYHLTSERSKRRP